MFDRLVQLDTRLFLWLNSFHSPSWDKIMVFISGKWEWLPFYAILMGFIIYKYRRKSIWIFLSITLVIALSDSISTRLIKETVERLRPSNNPEIQSMVHIVGSRGGKFGFISSHAANTFAMATFLSLLFRKSWFTVFIFLWATIISYSRIYLGLHYPADILGGAILGVLISLLFFYLYKRLTSRYCREKQI